MDIIPIPMFLPISGSSGEMSNKGCFFSLIFYPLILWLIFTITIWVYGDPFKKHQPTFGETVASEYNYVVGLFNRKTLAEERAEEQAIQIYGKKLNEYWGLTNLNALNPFTWVAPDTVYLISADLQSWAHPKQTATLSFSSLNIIYTGMPISTDQLNPTTK